MPEINKLYRRVRNKPLYIKDDGTVSSALYFDSMGVSVDVDDNRSMADIIKMEERLHKLNYQERLNFDPQGEFKLIAIASVTARDCQEKEIIIELDPIERINPYHAILKRTRTQIPLTASQRKHLARNTRIVKSYDSTLIRES